jgi:hypothetical protein
MSLIFIFSKPECIFLSFPTVVSAEDLVVHGPSVQSPVQPPVVVPKVELPSNNPETVEGNNSSI